MSKDHAPKVNNQYEMRDPRDQYPRPPFEKQPQEAPGLTAEMTPKPDHSEKSYQGFGRLKGRKALITQGLGARSPSPTPAREQMWPSTTCLARKRTPKRWSN